MEELTLADLRLLNKWWERHPPYYKLFEKYVGWDAPSKPKYGFTTEDLAQIPGVGIG